MEPAADAPPRGTTARAKREAVLHQPSALIEEAIGGSSNGGDAAEDEARKKEEISSYKTFLPGLMRRAATQESRRGALGPCWSFGAKSGRSLLAGKDLVKKRSNPSAAHFFRGR